ncbi:NACHT domain-containing protein, partial [Thelonectria olida]
MRVGHLPPEPPTSSAAEPASLTPNPAPSVAVPFTTVPTYQPSSLEPYTSSAAPPPEQSEIVAPLIGNRWHGVFDVKDGQPTPSPPTSSGRETSPHELQKRLWNQAYNELKVSQTKTVEAYEKILSGELHRNDSTATLGTKENEIGQTQETRWCQMKQLVQAGLERTRRQADIKQGIEDGLQAISAVRGIVDKAVQTAPEAALAWVGVCLGLEILSNPITETSINRQGIAYVISRMEWYWNLVCLLLDENRIDELSAGLRDELEKHVVQLYKELLLYQIKSVCLYRRNQAAVLLRDMFKLDDWDGQLNEIRDAENMVKRDSEQYNSERVKSYLGDLAMTAHSQEMRLRDIHSAIQNQIRLQERRYQDDKDEQCLKDLYLTDPRDDKKRIQDTKGGLLRDSYRWILDHADFRRFRDDPQSRLLWINGDPGKGKTMLLCGIIDELEKESATRLSYFFCQATEAQLSNATAVLRGLIYLLIVQQPSLISYVRVKYDAAGEKLFEGINVWVSLTEILTDMLKDPNLEDIVLVVDALDECRMGLGQLLDFVAQASSLFRAKWVLSSRNWPNIEVKLDKITQKVRLRLESNDDSISGAVHSYIQHVVNQLAHDKAYDDETRNAVEQHLTSNANNTFLWVALVCQELRDVSEIWDVLDVIKEMPAGLEDLYDRIMQQIQKLGRRNPEMCRSVLSTVTTAYRPLHLEELGHLSGLPPNIQRSNGFISKITSMCGSFLTIRDNVVYIIHQSARDFLLANTYLFPSGMREQHYAMFSRSLEALSRTLRRDIYSLRAPGFPIDQVTPPHPDPLTSTRYSCIYWVDHLCDSNPAQRKRHGEALQDGGAINTFLREKYLYWLEALSLLRSMSAGVMAMQKLEALVGTMETRQLREILRDACRFILSHTRAVEIAPLQVYASALVFSPARSLVRELFKEEAPKWIISKPPMEADWNACLQTLEGHSNTVNSVVFSADSRRLASGSGDKT